MTPSIAVSAPVAPISCALALGTILDVPNFGRAKVTAISLGPVAALVTLVKAPE